MIEPIGYKSKELLKERILAHASTLFYANGVKTIKMDVIAKDLVISKRTLYQFFPTKEELCLGCLQKKEEALCKHLEIFKENTKPNVIEYLMEYLLQKMKFFSNINPIFFAEIHKYDRIISYLENKEKEHFNENYALFQEGVKEGLFREDVDFFIITSMVRTSMNNAMVSSSHSHFAFAKIFHNIVFTVVRGFSTYKGIKIIDRLLFK